MDSDGRDVPGLEILSDLFWEDLPTLTQGVREIEWGDAANSAFVVQSSQILCSPKTALMSSRPMAPQLSEAENQPPKIQSNCHIDTFKRPPLAEVRQNRGEKRRIAKTPPLGTKPGIANISNQQKTTLHSLIMF